MNELIPELHDVGKLQNKYKHNFENFDQQFESKTWTGIIEHHCSGNFEKYPLSIDTFKLKVADILASAVSRPSEGEGDSIYNVYKLWGPPLKKITAPPINTEEQIQALIDSTLNVSTFESFVLKYGEFLKERTEDAHPKSNLTSLYTHMLLTGKFYRILSTANEYTVPQDIFKSKDAVCKAVSNKMDEWKLKLIRCKIKFSVNPVRAKDMNVFVALEDSISGIKQKFKDNILFSSSNELFLIVPTAEDILSKIFTTTAEYGFWMDIYREETIKLGAISKKGTSVFENLRNAKVMHHSLEEKIKPPICEICQMKRAIPEAKWVDEESNIVEELCESCFKIRLLPEVKLGKLVEWSNESEVKIAFIKISLLSEQLISVLNELYKEYSGNAEPISLSVISEFQWDYEKFLKEFAERVSNDFDKENVQLILDDFLMIKIKKLSDIKRILEIYKIFSIQYFSKFTQKSPIKLSVTCSNTKFPFFWHWRALNDVKDEVNINVIGKGEIHLRVSKLDGLLSINLPNIRILHNLAKASHVSKKLAWMMLNDKNDLRAYKDLEGLRKAVMTTGIGYSSILTYAKIMGD